MSNPLRVPVLALLLAGAAGVASAQVYTCVDAKGRRLTSDRPITECLDREQKVLNASGTVRNVLPPSLTAPERAALEERDRKLVEEKQRQEEDRRLRRALLVRYPNVAVHNREREEALKTAQEAIVHGQRQIDELQEQRRKLATEAEFFKTPAQWPVRLKRQVEENEQQTADHQRFIATHEAEKKRINARFDEELARLKLLWAQAQGTTAAAAAAAAASEPVKR